MEDNMDAQTDQPEKTRFFGNGSKQFSPKQPNRRDMTDHNRSCGMQMVVIFTKMVISRRGVTYLHSSVHVSCSEHSAACAMTQHKSRSVQMPMILRRFWIKKNPHGSGAQGSRLHCFLVRAQRRQDPNRHQCL